MVEVATWVCNLDAQMMGQPAYEIIQPEQYLAVDGSLSENEQEHFPQKLASAKH